MRAFVGLMLPSKAAAHLGFAVEPLRTRATTDAGVRWIGAERWHITLAFLGNIDEAQMPALSRTLGHIAQDAGALGSLRLHGSGQFDRTLWVGVDAPRPVHDLARSVQDAMRDAGINIERRPWRPHVTIARARAASAALAPAQAALADYAGPHWRPASAALIESVAGPQPQYLIRHDAALD